MSLCGIAEAHRLDECLQAALVGISDSSIEVELTLTPGIESVRHFLWLLDADANGNLDAEEGGRFGTLVLQSVRLYLDRHPLTLSLDGVRLPTKEELVSGTGRIEIRTLAPWALSAGSHVIALTNTFALERSVYLANALVPKNPNFTILSQQRNPSQSGLEIAFQKTPDPWPWEIKVGLLGTLIGAVLLGSVARTRKQRPQG